MGEWLLPSPGTLYMAPGVPHVVLIAPTSPARLLEEQPLALLDVQKRYELQLHGGGSTAVYRSLVRLGFVDRATAATASQLVSTWLATHSSPMLDVVAGALSRGVRSVTVCREHAALLVDWEGDATQPASVFFCAHALPSDFSQAKNGVLALQVDTQTEGSTGWQCGVQIATFRSGVRRKLDSDQKKVDKALSKTGAGAYQAVAASVVLRDIPSAYCMAHDPVWWAPLAACAPTAQGEDFDAFTQQLAGLFFMDATEEHTAAENCLRLRPTQESVLLESVPSWPLSPIRLSEESNLPLLSSSNANDAAVWLITKDFSAAVVQQLHGFTGENLLSMDKDDLIALCGAADGIRLWLTLAPLRRPRPTLNSSFTQTDESSMDCSS